MKKENKKMKDISVKVMHNKRLVYSTNQTLSLDYLHENILAAERKLPRLSLY